MPKLIISISIDEDLLEKLKNFRDQYHHKNYSKIIDILLRQRLKQIEEKKAKPLKE